MTGRVAVHALLATAVFAASATSVALAAELTPEDFAYARPIRTPDKAAVYRVALPLDVYQSTVRTDLGDLRIFNARGEAVPHSLRRPPTDRELRRPARPLPLFPLKGEPAAALDAVRVTIESGKAAVNVQTQSANAAPEAVLSYIADARALDALLGALELNWPSDAAEFAGRLKVEASDDLGTWRTVTEAAPVANLHADGERLVERRVELPPTKAKFWRLSWAGAAPPFPLTAVHAEPAAGRVATKRSELTVAGRPMAERPGEIVFDLGARLPVDRVNLELPERNSIVQVELQSRAKATDAWQPVIKHGFYRLETRNGEMRNGPVVIPSSTHRHWLVKVDRHGGGLGNGAPRLQAGWMPHEVVFVARGAAPFQMAYGSGAADRSEAALGAIPRDVPIVRASLDARRELGGAARLQPPPPPFPWKTALLWTVLALGVMFLAWMAYRLSRQL